MKITRSKTKELDTYIGDKIYHLRIKRGLPQEKIADIFKVSIQQFQKYEKGVNRISAANLGLLAKALGVDINYFYEGYDLENLEVKNKSNEEFIAISNKFIKIKSEEYRKAINLIIEALSKSKNNSIKS